MRERFWRNRYGLAITLFIFLILMPLIGVAERDFATALFGPGFLLWYISLYYLFSGHLLRIFWRKNSEYND